MSGTQPTRAESPPPSQRQYSCKLDKDGVLRYRPEPGDYKPKSPIEEPAWLSAVCSDISKLKSPTKHVEPYPKSSQLNKREDKLTCTFKTKKAKGKPPRKFKARSVSFYGDDIDENSSVVKVAKWVLGIDRLGVCAIEISEIFRENNINGSGLLKMTEETIKELGLDVDDNKIILEGIETLKVKSKARRSLDKAMDEV